MLDIKVIRENPEAIKQAAEKKKITCDVDKLCAVDDRRKTLQQELDSLRSQSNEVGPQMALFSNPKSDWYKQAIDEGKTPEDIKNPRRRNARETGRNQKADQSPRRRRQGRAGRVQATHADHPAAGCSGSSHR